MHAGLMGKSIIEKLCRIPVEVDIASEFRYRNPIIDEKTLCIFVSQSGETADIYKQIENAYRNRIATILITGNPNSSIAKISTVGVLTSGGDAPGMNAAIRAVTRASIFNGWKVMGIYRGYEGLINNEITEFTSQSVSNTIQRGGTILKTARSEEDKWFAVRGFQVLA